MKAIAALAAVASMIGAPAAAADVTVWNQQIETPVRTVLTNPCGEDIAFTGTFYRVDHEVTNNNGGPYDVHAVSHGELRNATAYGVTTGDAYRFINIGTSVLQADDVPYDPDTVTATTTMKLISRDGDNFNMHITFHTTVTPDGDITVAISDTRMDCSG